MDNLKSMDFYLQVCSLQCLVAFLYPLLLIRKIKKMSNLLELFFTIDIQLELADICLSYNNSFTCLWNAKSLYTHSPCYTFSSKQGHFYAVDVNLTLYYTLTFLCSRSEYKSEDSTSPFFCSL